jgi:phage shock protein PspC (stress-responsive transcriptional regulator)
MIKTFNINLAGQIFNINEDAYEHLSQYFNSLRTFYANEEDKDEIIRDIEARFAELFLAKGKNYIVTKADATEVVNLMGNPQEFDEENAAHSNAGSTTNDYKTSANTNTTDKRLYRDYDNSLITGVCAGLSAYFGIADPIWLRLLFIVFTIFGFGSPILLYIILSFIMPKAETAAQKLEMKGEPINLSNIEKKIKDEAENITGNVQKNGKGFFYNVLNFFVSIISLIIKAIIVIFKFIGIIIFSLMVFTLFILIIVFIVMSFFGAPAASAYFFTNSYDFLWISFGGILIMSTLFVFFSVLLYNRLYKNDKRILRKIILPILAFFITGIIFLNIGGNKIRKLLAEKKSVNQTVALNSNFKSDTLQITMNPSIKDEDYNNVEINSVSDLLDFISDHKDNIIPVEIEILQSANDSFSVEKEYSARGKDDKDALQNATSFRHNLTQVNNKIIIDPYIKFDTENAKYRNQKLKLRVYIPEGKIIKWDKRTEEYINLKKVYINWDNIKYPVPPVPPTPPLPPGTNQNRKIEIKTSKSGDTAPSKIVINIDTDNEDINAALDKAQEKLDEAREKLDNAETIDIEALNDAAFEARIHRQHYIFRMVNGELVPID